MMTDKRSFDGWQRLSRSVMRDVATDDPAGLAQVRQVLDQLQADYLEAMAALTGQANKWDVTPERPYSHAELAADLGITRQAVSKKLAGR